MKKRLPVFLQKIVSAGNLYIKARSDSKLSRSDIFVLQK